MINPKMIQKLQKMQDDMKRVQAEINQSTFYGQAGGSVVKVSVKGTKEVIDVQIKKDEIDISDIDMLQDLIVTAVNDALKKVDKEIEESIGSITKGMSFPGMF